MNTQVFFVTALSNPETVAERLSALVAEPDRFELSDHQWLVVYPGLSRDLAEKLGVRGEPNVANGVVFPVTSYSGRANPALWEWLSLNMSRS